MKRIDFKRQDELVQASLVFSMLHSDKFRSELDVNFSYEEMDRAMNFFAKRKPPRRRAKK